MDKHRNGKVAGNCPTRSRRSETEAVICAQREKLLGFPIIVTERIRPSRCFLKESPLG
jgi:hypothetical protein